MLQKPLDAFKRQVVWQHETSTTQFVLTWPQWKLRYKPSWGIVNLVSRRLLLPRLSKISNIPKKRCTGCALIVRGWQATKAPASNACITLMTHEHTPSSRKQGKL